MKLLRKIFNFTLDYLKLFLNQFIFKFILSFQNCSGEPVYRKVAVVENFFDIIYNVHVELEGRPGKHAGQKRTYRTVSTTHPIFLFF